VVPLITAVFTLVGMVYVCARIDFHLALIALAISPVLFALSLACSRLVRRRSQEIKELDSTALSVIQEVLGSIRLVKAFGQENREQGRFVRHSSKRMSGQVQLSMMQAVFNLLIGLTIAGGTAAALYIGVRHVRSGLLTVGSLLMVMAYIAQMYGPLQHQSHRPAGLVYQPGARLPAPGPGAGNRRKPASSAPGAGPGHFRILQRLLRL
jgi:ATP-binding cassette subfamily B protein